MERKLLSICLFDREDFERVQPLINTREDLSDKGNLIYKYIKEFYDTDENAEKVDTDLLLSTIERNNPNHIEQFRDVVESLTPTSASNVIKEVMALKRYNKGLKLSNLLLNGSDSDIDAAIAEYVELASSKLADEDDGILCGVDLEDLYANGSVKDFKLYPGSLNTILEGGVSRQNHIIIYAKPEVGKSLFCLNIAAGLCGQGHKVLYIGLEEPAKDLLTRFQTRLTMWDKDRVQSDMGASTALSREKGYDNFMLYHMAGATPAQITKLVIKYKPDVLIVDQILKMNMPSANDEMTTVTKASDFMRKMGIKHNLLAVSVTQAGAEAKLVLKQSDIYQSSTAVAGDADLMIGIGTNDAFEKQNKRMISLPKNKISGKHDYFVVGVDPIHSKVLSL